MINTETSLGNDTQLQILWIPDTTYQYLPVGGSYTFTTSRLIPQAPEGYDVVLNKENRPKNLFNDSDIGVKFRFPSLINPKHIMDNHPYI